MLFQKRYEIDTLLLQNTNTKWYKWPVELCHCQWPWSTFEGCFRYR